MSNEKKEMIRVRKLPLALLGVFLAVAFVTVANAQISETSFGSDLSSSYQYYQPGFQSYYSSAEISTYWPILGKEECRARQDFILTIPPGGCQPAVVRSDLLEEQNVPVFCQIDAIKLNPLIDIEAIDSISFRGQYPKDVAGVGFHPARAAVRSYNTLLGSPLINNAGYLVVTLKRQNSEKEMPDSVQGNLTAMIRYDIENAFGAGRAEFVLPVITDLEWANTYQAYGFWRGRGFLRVTEVDENGATISVYSDATHRESSVKVQKGKTSDEIYLGGFYCQAALQLHLNDITSPQTRAKIIVSKDGKEDNLWLYQDSAFVDNKCRITRIDPISLGGGSAVVRCGSQEFTLSLGTANSMKIEVSGKEQTINLWEPVSGSIKYVAFAGEVPRSLEGTDENRVFIVGITTSRDINEAGQKIVSDRIRYILDTNAKKAKDKKTFKENSEKQIAGDSLLKKQGVTGASIIFYGDSGSSDIKFLGAVGSEESSEAAGLTGTSGAKVIDDYFNKAVSEYRRVVQLYPAEKTQQVEKKETIGEVALDSADQLATYLGKQATKQEILRDEQNYYPNTEMAESAKKAIAKTLSYDEKYSAKTIKIGFDYYTFQLEDIIEPSLDEASATISVDNGEQGTYAIGDYIVTPEKSSEFMQLYGLEEGYAIIRHSYTSKDSNSFSLATTKTEKVKLKEISSLGNFSVYVSDIKLQRVANIAVEPKITGPYTETNLSFQIGVEKRGIKLSPEKTKEMISSLNDSIEKWQSISSKLASVVKGWKAACFATSGFLLVKNLIDNFSGKSMARQKVMRGADGSSGWIAKCKEMVSRGDKGYTSLDGCLYGENSEIEKDVGAAQKAISDVNAVVKSREIVKEETIFGEKILDTQKSFEGFMGDFKNSEGSNQFNVYKDGAATDKKFSVSDMIGDYSKAYTDGIYTFSDAREWLFDEKMANNPEISESIRENYRQKLSEEFDRINNRRTDMNTASDYNNALKTTFNVNVEQLSKSGREIVTPNIFTLDKSTAGKISGLDYTAYGAGNGSKEVSTYWTAVEVPSGTYVETGKDDKGNIIKDYKYGGKVLLVPLALSGGKYVPISDDKKPAYFLNTQNGLSAGNAVSPGDLNQIMGQLNIDRFDRIEKGKCNNPYKNPQVRFNEVEPFKGMPGVVPIDVKNGWYVATKQSISGFGLTAYTDAGVLKNFYLCNVGKDGTEDFESGLRDDSCTLISLETGASINHPCLTESEAKSLVSKAQGAVMEAAQQYAAGVKKVRILGQSFDVGVPVGGASGTQCQDFMSPQDCYILFNACDPVLCPSSRCNLGGAYPVKDVVQSGIIGSIALCLPNAKEGIFVPVCLTGVQAGIDAYLGILKAHRDCLQESLNSGKMVGICDEIYSVYLCEFFWRQFAPLMDIFIPKMIELAYGQGTRGGGEYLTITHAWNTLDNSVKYFTDYYAQNAFQAFKVRSTEEAGTEICKSFISARYPAGKDFFDKLTEPESPVQYSAWFDEIPFTGATIPATSQYKVFYYIWAGKDQGGQYEIYLKDPPESSYYSGSPRIYVDTGYIGRGNYVSQTKDFTAPAGYKTLCVRVNLQEECGFGKVSTSFAVNYLGEQYAAEQATQQVITEKDCVAGTPSLYSAIQPNIEQAGQEIIQPEMYKQGIIRICSTENPGKQTAPERWKDVGYCGEQKLRCWLDMNSVKEVIKNNNTLAEVTQAVGEIDKQKLQGMIETKEIMDESESESKLRDARQAVDAIRSIKVEGNTPEEFARALENNYISVLSELSDVEDRGFHNYQKAEAILLKGQIYDGITRRIYEMQMKPQEPATTPATTTAPAAAGGTEPEESKASTEAFVLKNNLVYYRESYTSLYLRETANKRGYIIWQQKNIDIIDASPGLIAGAIIDGKISFNSQLKTTGEYAGYADSINNLKNNYDFDTASKQFIPKK